MKPIKKVNKHGYQLEWREGERWNEKSFSWYMECSECREPVRVGSDSLRSVTCWKCVSKKITKPIVNNDIN